MKPILRVAASVLAALLVLFAADRLLQPVPVPAATTALGGFFGWWLGRGARRAWMGGGIAAGLLAGVGVHLYVHATAQSPPPAEGLAAHLAVDGAVGLLVALLAVGSLVGVYRATASGRTAKARRDRPG